MSGSNGIKGVGGQPGLGGGAQSGGLVGEAKNLAEGTVGAIAARAGDPGGVGNGGRGVQGGQVEGGQRGQQGVAPPARGPEGPNNPGQGGRVNQSDGPGRNGQGNAYGLQKQDDNSGPRGRRGGGDDQGRPPQLLADEPRVSQLRHRIENQQQQRGGRQDVQPDGGRVRDFGPDNRPDRATQGRPDSPRLDAPGRDNNLRPRDLPSSIESFARDAHARARSAADGATSLLFRAGEGRDGRGVGRGQDDGLGPPRLNDSAAGYLRGLSDGADLPDATRAVLDSVKQALGPSALTALSDKETGKVLRLVERALDHMGRSVEHALKRGDDMLRLPGNVTAPPERFTRAGMPAASPDQLVRELADELLGAALLGRHLKRLEGTGGIVVRQAEEMIARLLYGRGGADGRHAPQPAPGQQPAPAPEPRLHPQEFLRDLREGLFMPRQEQYNPFPLTGRARVVAEMMELMRTLDAVEGALRQASAQAGARAGAETHVGALLKAHLAGALGAALDEVLALLTPTLPGRAARYEIPRAVAAMNGLLTDADGRALLARDGTPLKLDRLVWLSAAGGLLAPPTLGSVLGGAFGAESLPTRLSPLLVYGFDAIYSVIGFDGRTLAAPHFVTVQAAVNDSESEWVFGQQPFTAGWVCALVERLKDSAVVEHNLLGEMLEEAWADGRFHVAVLGVAVEQGETVPDSSGVTHLLPGPAGELAFA